MNRLCVEPAKATPAVDFDPTTGVLKLQGQSYPENAFKFYEPLLTWLDDYLLQDEAPVSMEIKLSYLNTSSSKCMLMLLDRLEDAYRKGQRITLRWSCDADNESEWECAEEFKEDVSFPFTIVPLAPEC